MKVSALIACALASVISLQSAFAAPERADLKDGAKKVKNSFTSRLYVERWKRGEWRSTKMGTVNGQLTVDLSVDVPVGEYKGSPGTVSLDNGVSFNVVTQVFAENRPNLGLCLIGAFFGSSSECNRHMYQRSVILDREGVKRIALAANSIWYHSRKTEDAAAALLERTLPLTEQSEFHLYSGMITGYSKGKARERFSRITLEDRGNSDRTERLVVETQFDNDVYPAD